MNLVEDIQFESKFNKTYVNLYDSAKSMNARQLIDYLNTSDISTKVDELVVLFNDEGIGLRYNKQTEMSSVVSDLEHLRDIEKKWTDMTTEERIECEKKLANLRVYYHTVK
ncbi:hypothetical protein [Fusibacter sp. JL216-2]|uniref:hypothetical protein n=1 Tax=Fusibacter sp. JL216-2 TaxID=3071453 RepID=UPI003D350F73